jgi:hypothetical protein
MEFFFGAFEVDWERRRAALLHERSLGGGSRDEDERRRRGGAVPSAPRGWSRGSALARPTGLSARTIGKGSASEPSMRSRFKALASGSQPAVVKMVSFGGGGRLGAMINYVSRNGEVGVENERGEELRGRDELSAVRGEWDHLMKNRTESRDIGTFVVEVTETMDRGGDLHQQARAVLKRGLGDRSFVFAVSARDGGYTIEGVVVLRDSQGERLTADAKASEIVQERLSTAPEIEASFRFTGYGNGTEYGTGRLRNMVGCHDGNVEDEAGKRIGDAKQAGDLVQLEWRDQLHSRKSRDVMHLILSARAGTDVEKLKAASRDFLAQEFSGHRYVFALHDPSLDPKAEDAGGKRPHVHVHAIVAMRSEHGERVETTIRTFRQWRVTMAEKARDHGIDMEMTDRRERASAAGYNRNQVRPISRVGRTEHEGTSAASHVRYETKRSDKETFARTELSLDYSLIARREWAALAKRSDQKEASDFARTQVSRHDSEISRRESVNIDAPSHEKSHSQFRTNLVKLMEAFSEGEDMRQMTRDEFEVYEKQVETALFQAERVMTETDRAGFDEIASAAREHVDARRELIASQEQNGERAVATDEQRGREPDDDANARWDLAVARHGVHVVEAANDIMLEVEHYREAIELADAGEIKGDKASLQASLNVELGRAAELGAAGNSLVREIAEVDTELRIALEAAERSRERSGSAKSDGGGTASAQSRSDEGYNPNREDRADRRLEDAETDRPQVKADERRQDRATPRPGDTTRSDPAQQHIPRLEQLQREADEDRERDDRDR